MKILFVFLSLYSVSAISADCHLWSVKGKIVYERPDFILLSAAETQSQTKLSIPLEEQHKLMPFLNHAVEAQVLLAEADVPKKTKILRVEGAERIVPDPLGENKSTVFRKTGTRPCP